MKHFIRSTVGAVILATTALTGASTAAQAQTAQTAQTAPTNGAPADSIVSSCQRACLEGFVNRYLDAMAAHKVDPALFAKDVRFTENGIELPFGTEGLWATASGVGKYKLYVPDIETQQVAFLGTVLEVASSSASGPARGPELVGLSLRLRIVDGKITEVEQIAARPERPLGAGGSTPPPTGAFAATGAAVEAMGAPDRRFLEAIPANKRQSRADLVRIGNYYFDAVERNTGKDYYPFTDDCLRHENGMVIVGPPGTIGMRGQPVQGCKEQLQKTLIGAVSGIRDRRFVAVDRERGIVFAFGFFDHRPINWTWQLGELFKIEGENISRIEAIFIRGAYGVCSGWSTQEQCRSEKIQDVR